MQRVEIRWRDAQDHADKWVDEDDAKEFGDADCVIVSIGYLVSQTAKYLTLAGDWDATDKDFGRVTKIPSSMLVSIENLIPVVVDPESKPEN